MKIEDAGVITKRTKVHSLEATPRKILSLLSILSHTNRIVFDLVGQSPDGTKITYDIVKEVVREGGSAILLDWANDMKKDCSKYIELEWKTERKSESPPPFKIQIPVIKRDKK